ncbi:MAG: GNAT family N-acetyltransferase, partial [Eubacteriales bacterium]|nr:GNAT family N-acetyltransferase [Eubacteriales bacterium]
MENNALTLAQDGELDAAMRLIDQAKAHLKELGVNQWQTGYPDRACIRQDIERGRGYFLTDGAALRAYLCIDFDGEPAYDHLRGEWENQPPYAVVHRLAVGEAYRGCGLASEAFRLTEALCRAR